jgi:hypothetical protein
VLQAGSKWRGDGSGVTPPMSCEGGLTSEPQELKVMLATAKVAAAMKVRAVVVMVSSLLELWSAPVRSARPLEPPARWYPPGSAAVSVRYPSR